MFTPYVCMRRMRFLASYTAFDITMASFSDDKILNTSNYEHHNKPKKFSLLLGILVSIIFPWDSSESVSLSPLAVAAFLSFNGNESANAFNGKTVDFSSLQFSDIVK